jgi:hypothetical protein
MSEDSEERPGSFEGRGAPSWLDDINKEFGASSESSDFGTTHEVYGTSSQLAAGRGLAQAAIDDVFGSPNSPHVSPTKSNVAPSLPPDSSFLIYLNSTLSQRTGLNSEDTKNESSSNDEADYHHQQLKEREEFSCQQSDLESPWELPPKNDSSSSVPSKSFSTNCQDHPTPIQANVLPASKPVSPSKTTITPQEVVNSEYRSDTHDVQTTGSEDQLLIQFSSTESKGFSSPKSCLSLANQTSPPSTVSTKKLGFADLLTTTKDQHTTTSLEKTRSVSTQDQEQDDTSQLSGSQTDVDDLISRFTETKTSLDDLDDILGPMGTESFDRHAAAIAKTSSYSPRKAASSSTLLMHTIAEVPLPNSTMVDDLSTVMMANQNELRAKRDNKNQPTQPYTSFRDSGRPAESLATMKWDKELAKSLAAPPSPPPRVYAPADVASQQPPDNPLDRIVASLEKNLPPMGPAKKHHKRRPPAINSMTSDSTTGTYSTGTGTGTFDSSSSSETSPSDALGSALSKESSSSFWASTQGTGTSRDASFASPGTADTESLRSPGTTASRSPGGTTSSPSASTGRSSSPSTTIGSPSTLGNVTRSQDSLMRDETGTSGASGTHPEDLSTQGDNSTQLGASMSAASFGLRPMSTSLSDHQEPYAINSSHTSRSDQHEPYAINSSHTSRSDQQEELSTIHYDSSNTSAESEEPRSSHRQAAGQSGGSRLWELANKEAARSKSRDGPLTPEASKFAESLMARTRSRAEPDAVVSSSGSHDYQGKIQGPGLLW